MDNKLVIKWIIAVSAFLLGVVCLLYFSEPFGTVDKDSIVFLPRFHAILNSMTAISLICGAWTMKKKKNQKLHSRFMVTAFVLSSIFLVSYVVYHSLAPETKYGGDGILKGVYYFVLISHILLSMVVVPFVLMAFYFALSKQFAKHRKIVKWTLPIWLYVAFTGVLVYIMISPYY